MAYGAIHWCPEDTVATLKQRYRQERDGDLRPRWQALWLLRAGRPRGEVAAVVGVHARTLRDWIAWYRQGGCAAVAQHRRGNPQGAPAYLTAAQQAALLAHARTTGFRRVAEAQQWVETTCGVVYTYDGMRTLLRRLGCRPKVPRPLHADADLAAQTAWQKGGCAKRSPSTGRPARRPSPGPTSSASASSGRCGGSGRRAG